MNHKSLTLAIALATGSLALTACQPASDEAVVKSEALQSNPFFTESTLQYKFPQFDQIKFDHYAPAFEKGMTDHLAEIALITDNAEPATFENTIVALEKSGDLLGRVSTVFFNLGSTDTNDQMDALEQELAPKLSAHSDAIFLNAALFNRINDLFERRNDLNLDPESYRLLEQYHIDFVRAGAMLDDAAKERMKVINEQMASLTTTFSQNVQNESIKNAIVVDTLAELEGMSENAIAAAAKAATDKGMDGKYLISLTNTSGQPPLSSLVNRALRERIAQASVSRGTSGGEYDNRQVISDLSRLRAERAALLGYPSHADFVLENATAKTSKAVNDLLTRLAPAAVANAAKEAADMQTMIQAEGGKFKLAAHDWAFYAEKVRQARYEFDESQLKPYFEINNVLENGLFFAMGKLYGLSFKERNDLPKYHPDTRIFEVFEENGEPLGIFIADFYARDSKRGGAWMNSYVQQSGLYGDKPVVANHLNVPKPPEGQPTLMTYDEVNTMFHEFGHAVHGLFSNVKYPRFSGTSVPRDFVEYPSQVHEMWVTWPEVFTNYAKHHQTGEPMPKELLEKVMATSKFNQGFATTEYLAASLLDQAYHNISADQAPTAEQVLDFEANALKKAGVLVPAIPPRYRSGYFSHIFAGGYSSGYYAYIWSEVLDADSVEWFKENGGLTRANGDHFRATLLSRGGSKEAMELFRDFRGRDADIQPLLERRGLTGQ